MGVEAEKREDDERTEHVQLEIAGELSALLAVTISWKGRLEELVGLLAGKSWEEVVKHLRYESRQTIVCPARGRQAPSSIVLSHLFPVHLNRIHQIAKAGHQW